jgi:DNA-binding LytR/AlgR family response regulator
MQRRGLLLAVLAALFMSAIGALGSDQLPMAERLAYWLAMMVTGTVMGLALIEAARRLRLFETRPVVQGALVTLALWIPQTLSVSLVDSLAFAQPWTAGLRGSAVPVLIISAAMTALNYLADRTPARTHALPSGSAPPRFLQRLPLRLRGADLYALEAEDHYLRAHTSKGQDLLLFRLADAIAELEGIEGAQIHRSWWVARGAIDEVRRGDGRAILTLKDGARAPVSRTFARALRQAGWF